MNAVTDIAAQAGPGIGAGIGAWGGFRFIRWAVEFIAARIDTRSARLDERERDLERRFNARLRHVEVELERYREATMRLVNALAERDPSNPVLSEVSKILRRTMPIIPPSSEFGELTRQAGEALDGQH